MDPLLDAVFLDLLIGRNCHGGEETNDHSDDHDLDEGECFMLLGHFEVWWVLVQL